MQKTAELIEMPFGWLTPVGPTNRVLDDSMGVEISPLEEAVFGGCLAH